MSDPMARYTELGKTPGGLRHFAHRMLAHNTQFGGGYAIHVLDSAADEMDRLLKEIEKLHQAVAEQRQRNLL